MKKKIAAVITAIGIIGVLAVGCGGGKLSNKYVEISQYKGLEIAKVAETKAQDEEVDQQIQSTLEQNATTTDVTDRAVETGDTTVIDFVGTQDGVEFENGSGTDYELVIGSESFIPGFEDGIIGHNINDNFDLTLTFPEDYSNDPDLAGQEVVFNVTLKAIKQSVVPELNDEFVQTVSEESKTVDEYKAEVKKALNEQYKEQAESTLAEEAWEALLEKTKVKEYPKDSLKEIEDQMRDEYNNYATYYNLELAEFLESYMNMTEEEYEEMLDEQSKKAVKQELAMELISDKEKLGLSDKEKEKKYEEYVEQYGYESVEALKEAATDEVLEKVIMQEAVQEWLVENSKQVDASELEEKDDTEDTSSDSAETEDTDAADDTEDNAETEDSAE